MGTVIPADGDRFSGQVVREGGRLGSLVATSVLGAAAVASTVAASVVLRTAPQKEVAALATWLRAWPRPRARRKKSSRLMTDEAAASVRFWGDATEAKQFQRRVACLGSALKVAQASEAELAQRGAALVDSRSQSRGRPSTTSHIEETPGVDADARAQSLERGRRRRQRVELETALMGRGKLESLASQAQ
eukprot:2328525-Alexandrium_andersonii.AAC.1